MLYCLQVVSRSFYYHHYKYQVIIKYNSMLCSTKCLPYFPKFLQGKKTISLIISTKHSGQIKRVLVAYTLDKYYSKHERNSKLDRNGLQVTLRLPSQFKSFPSQFYQILECHRVLLYQEALDKTKTCVPEAWVLTLKLFITSISGLLTLTGGQV